MTSNYEALQRALVNKMIYDVTTPNGAQLTRAQKQFKTEAKDLYAGLREGQSPTPFQKWLSEATKDFVTRAVTFMEIIAQPAGDETAIKDATVELHRMARRARDELGNSADDAGRIPTPTLEHRAGERINGKDQGFFGRPVGGCKRQHQ